MNAVVTDSDGSTGNTSFTVVIDDDVPVAADDAGYGPYNENAVNVDLGLASVLLANDKFGADGAAATGSLTIAAGNHGGTITIDPSGHMIYTNTSNVANGVTDEETFTYTIKDGDNDTATAMFTVSRTDSGVTMGAAPANLLADEDNIPVIGNNDTQTGDDAQTLTGTISYTLGSDHIGSVALSTAGNATGLFKLDGTAIQTSWDGTTRTLTGYGTGVSDVVFTIVLAAPTDTGAGYTLTLLQPVKHADGLNENNTPAFTVNAVVTDSDGSTGNTSFTVVIDDDVPVAADDTYLPIISGPTVISGLFTNDVFGADGVDTDNSPVSGQVTVTDGAHGTVTYNNNGTFTYTPTGVYVGTDSFTYTIKDGDGDTSTATVNVSVQTNTVPTTLDGVSALTVNEAALDLSAAGSDLAAGVKTGTNPGSTAETFVDTNGLQFQAAAENIVSIKFADPNNLVDAYATPNFSNLASGTPHWTLSGDGRTLTLDFSGQTALILALSGASSILAGATGNVTVSATLVDRFVHLVPPSTLDVILNGVKVVATDASGDETSGTVSVNIVDDAPL
ncbi:MAG TPA: Ig-like domain-containing protein, partial [Vicinamibacterales bacterium]